MMRHPERDREHEGEPARILLDICDAAEEDGYIDILTAGYDGAKFAYLRYFEMDEERAGHGTTIMQKLCDAADEHGFMIELETQPSDRDGLRYFYGHFGFEPVGDPETRCNVMRRQPRGIRSHLKKMAGWITDALQ